MRQHALPGPGFRLTAFLFALCVAAAFCGRECRAADSELDRRLASDNAGRSNASSAKLDIAPRIDDAGFIRRATVDLIGRIPTLAELKQYEAWPAAERRQKLVDKLLQHQGFGDRWTVFMADLLRVRSTSPGGAAMLAYVHSAVQDGMPYDELCRQLIIATGQAGRIPEVGWVLGDNADPMALTAATAQVFMGVRIACAQCHDHPFDVWKREQFYGLAAYFGKTAQRESRLINAILVYEKPEAGVKWPPEGVAPEDQRKVMKPKFPFALETASPAPQHIARLASLRKAKQDAAEQRLAARQNSLEDLLAVVDRGSTAAGKGSEARDVARTSAAEARALHVEKDINPGSDLRRQLAELVTDPHNRYFSRAFVNRLWANLMGRGFVEPCDDFNDKNPPSHGRTLDYLADEFVASGYDLRMMVRVIMLSDAYQRAQLPALDESRRLAAESAFTAAPLRRMLAETLFDSLVTAGHLFDVKHPPGENIKTIREIVQVPVDLSGKGTGELGPQVAAIDPAAGGGGAAMSGMSAAPRAAGGGYDLESAIEVDFKQVLQRAREVEPQVAAMEVTEEESAKMMQARAARRKYVDKVVETTVDDNPKYTSAMRMPSPAPPAHFLRIFGQPARDLLGDHRDHSPSMRQALMMLNGRLTHEASRVGKSEPIYALLASDPPQLPAAVTMAYREILTRAPSDIELQEGLEIVRQGATTMEGLADLRWALFNSHEFRFIP